MKTKSFTHQIEGTKALVKNKCFALFDEMGAGKSKQVIDAACILAEAGEIDTVVIVAPASVRGVWLHPEIGEIKKHSWVCNHVFEYHSKSEIVWEDLITPDSIELMWCVTNYEFLRREERLTSLIKMLQERKVMLVLDESSYIKSRTAKQTKAVYKIRQLCLRCVLLNGTPVVNNPLDLWSQFQIMDKRVLGTYHKNYWAFRAHYAVMGGFKMKQVVQWVNLDYLSKLVAPWVLRRLKKDCLDLPPKLFTQREVPLTAESWKRYCELRKEAVLALPTGDQLLEPNAAVRVMRLCQLTSGHIGLFNIIPPRGSDGTYLKEGGEPPLESVGITDLSSEKIDFCIQYLTEECQARYVIVWCRWRRERERLVHALRESKGEFTVQELYGGQGIKARELAVSTFTRNDLSGRHFLIAQPHAGGHGLNLVAATEVIYLSNDWSLGIRLQSEDRCHRPGQNHPVTYIDVIATGPNGQRTVDSIIQSALAKKQELSQMTTGAWRKALTEEGPW